MDRREPLERARLGVAHQVREGTHPRQVRRVRPFCALAEEHRDALVVCSVRRVRGQTGLAHPGFAGDEGNAQSSFGRRLLAQLGQERQLGSRPENPKSPPAAYWARRTGRDTLRRAVLAHGLPTRFDRRDGTREAFQLEGPQRDELERGVTAHGEARQLGGQDLAGRGRGTQTGGLDDGVPEEVPSSSMASPVARPIRTSSAVSPRRLWRSSACWISTAQENARLALEKTIMSPSPRFLTSLPPVDSTAARRRRKVTPAHLVGSIGAHGGGELGRSDEVGEQECGTDALAHRHSPYGSGTPVGFGYRAVLARSDAIGVALHATGTGTCREPQNTGLRDPRGSSRRSLRDRANPSRS